MSKRQALLFAVLLLAVLSWIWPLLPKSLTAGRSIGDWMSLISGAVALLSGTGLVTEKPQRTRARVTPFRLTASFRGGLFGGLIGGAIAGFISGMAYYLTYHPVVGFENVLEVCMYGAVLGGALGGCCLFTILLGRHLTHESGTGQAYLVEILAGLLGGVISGVVIGIPGGWYFYPKPYPPASVAMILLGAVVAPLLVVGGALLYDYGGRLRNVITTFVGALFIAVLLAIVTAFVLRSLGIGEGDWWSTIGDTKSGAILGGGIGAMLGLQVGITLVFHRLQEGPPEPRRARR